MRVSAALSRRCLFSLRAAGRSQRMPNSHRSGSSDADTSDLIEKLRRLDTACLCDADKSLLAKQNESSSTTEYTGLRVLQGLNCLNSCDGKIVVGVARTVQFTTPNDFFPVLQALNEAHGGEILVVNTLDSTLAVAGGLFGSEADRKGVAGFVIDGPMRDIASLQSLGIRCFSRSVTPYSGTVQSLGKSQVDVECGNVRVSPGDILVGDDDGIVAASVNTFERIIESARYIQSMEHNVMVGISNGLSLHSMTNYVDHLQALESGKESDFQLHGIISDETSKSGG